MIAWSSLALASAFATKRTVRHVYVYMYRTFI